MFADALNHRFEPNEPWRLQERPNAELTGREEPEYGRRAFTDAGRIFEHDAIGPFKIEKAGAGGRMTSRTEYDRHATLVGMYGLARHPFS